MAEKTPLLYENVFSISPEKAVTVAKIPTRVTIYLQDTPGGSELTGKTLPIGTTINVRCVIEWQDASGVWRWLLGKTLNIYQRYDTRGTDKIYSGPPTSNGYYDISVRLIVAGVNTFYAEFLGDDTYAGCEKAVRAFVKCSVC